MCEKIASSSRSVKPAKGTMVKKLEKNPFVEVTEL
jgi:hypothetical protein